MMFDADINVTYITLGGHIQVPRFKYLYFIIMFVVYLLIMCSNFIIFFIIVVEKSLHEPMYAFIAALLLNSVLFSTAIYPKLLIDFLSQRQIVSYSACLFQSFLFYSLGGSEYFLLAAMAYDRYVSICKPLQYPIIMRKTTVCTFLVLAWLVPISHLVVQTIMNMNKKICSNTSKGIICNNTFSELYCVITTQEGIGTLVVMFNVLVLPVIFILFTYARILVTAYRSCGEVRKKAAQTCSPHLMVLFTFSILCAYDVLTFVFNIDLPKVVNLIMTLQIITYQPLLNPIIYGLKMKEISKHVKKLLCRAKVRSFF